MLFDQSRQILTDASRFPKDVVFVLCGWSGRRVSVWRSQNHLVWLHSQWGRSGEAGGTRNGWEQCWCSVFLFSDHTDGEYIWVYPPVIELHESDAGCTTLIPTDTPHCASGATSVWSDDLSPLAFDLLKKQNLSLPFAPLLHLLLLLEEYTPFLCSWLLFFLLCFFLWPLCPAGGQSLSMDLMPSQLREPQQLQFLQASLTTCFHLCISTSSHGWGVLWFQWCKLILD